MTLKELLENEALKDLTVINRGADLKRQVSTVEQTETPDVVSYISMNSFLITTAMVYKEDQNKLCELILHLNELPCAGLGIKMGRFVHELDEKVIQTADSVGLPLICIPMQRTLGDVYHDFLSLIWETENQELINALNIRKKFYNLIIHGISLRRLLSMLGATLNKHVLILDRFGVICGTCNTTRQEEQMAIEIIKKIDKDKIEVERQSFFSVEDNRETEALVYPIKSINRKTHFLLVFEEKDTSVISAFVMEEILLILGMHFYKKLFNYYNEMQFKENFMKLILTGEDRDCWSNRQILALGQGYGLKAAAYYKSIVCRFLSLETQKFNAVHLMRKEEKYILVYHYLERKINAWFQGNILVFPDIDNWRYIFLIQEKDLNVNGKLKEISETVFNAFGEQMVFANGNDVYEAGSIVNSYYEAVEVLNHLPEDSMEYVFTYQPQNIMELLKGISGNQMKAVCKRMLKELAFPEDEMYIELKRTLKAYLDCRCSIMETANRLYLHRNTVRYRIRKCEEILKQDLNDADYCFQLQLCLILSDMDR